MAENETEVKHVSVQDYVVACAQDGCGARVKGTVRDLVEHGWVYTLPGDRTVEGGWFCPACTMGLKRA